MKKSEILKEFEDKEEKRDKSPGTPYFKAYHKGYGYKEVDSGDGLTRNEYVYQGIWHVFSGSAKKKNILKVVHALLWLAIAACLVICGLQRGTVNSSKIFAAPFFGSALMAVICFFALIFYLISPLNMQEYDYVRAIKRFKIFYAVLGICAAVGIIISVILMISLGDYSIASIASCLSFLGAAAGAFASLIIEMKQQYIDKIAE